MAGPWSAGRLVGLLADLRATSRSHSSLFTLHSSLFTLHSSDFEREWVPVWLGPGRLVGWRGCSLISARPRDHTLHSSLFTLRVQKGTGTHMRLAWRAGGPPRRSDHPRKISPLVAATSHTLHSSLFTLHSSDFERERVPVCNEPGRAHEFGDQSFVAPRPPPQPPSKSQDEGGEPAPRWFC
jgi:hypothetical protein